MLQSFSQFSLLELRILLISRLDFRRLLSNNEGCHSLRNVKIVLNIY